MKNHDSVGKRRSCDVAAWTWYTTIFESGVAHAAGHIVHLILQSISLALQSNTRYHFQPVNHFNINMKDNTQIHIHILCTAIHLQTVIAVKVLFGKA